METRFEFVTYLKGDVEVFDRNFIEDLILMIGKACSEEREELSVIHYGHTGDTAFTFRGTRDEYNKFRRVMDGLYPGLCIFDGR